MKKRGLQRHMALLLAVMLLLPLFAAPSAGLAEQPLPFSFHVAISHADNPVAPITRDAPVAFTFHLQFGASPAQHFDALKSEVFYVYLLRGLFAGAEQVDIVNPLCSTQPDGPYRGEQVFAENQLTREPGRDTLIDGEDYACYSIRLNGSADAQAYFEAEAPMQAVFSFTKLLGQGMLPTPGQKVAVVMDAAGTVLGEGSITIADSAEQPALPEVSIFASMQARYVWDAAYQTDAAGAETGAYLPSNELEVCTPGDLIVLQLELANQTAEPLLLTSVTEHLPDGYRMPDWSSSRLLGQDGALVPIQSGAMLLPEGAPAGLWQPTELAQTYRYAFDAPAQLAPGTSITVYFIAEVQQGGSLLHTITVLQENGAQPVATYEPVMSGQHDLALSAKLETVYNKQNEPVASYPDTRPVPAVNGARMGMRFRVENQGQPVGGVTLAAYVPLGFAVLGEEEAFPGGSNAGWEFLKRIPMDAANGIWSDLSVYRYTFPAEALAQQDALETTLYVSVQGAIGERKPGGYPEDVYLPTDYYLAGEIAAFLDENGKPAMDADSTPDSDPANDLFDNRTGITRYHPINLYQKVQEGSYVGEVKETPGNTAGRAKLRHGLLQDEDDFDFDYASPAKSGVPQPEYGAYLTTRRVPAAITPETLLTHFGEGALSAITGPLAEGGMQLLPVADGGVLSSMRSYMLYELWINKDGLADTAGSSLELTLPEGLYLPTYAQEGAAYDLLRVTKYQALQRAPGLAHPNSQIIRYDPGFVAEHEVLFPWEHDASILRNAYPLAGSDAAQPQELAAAYGLHATISADRRNLQLKFGTPMGHLQAHQDTHAAYRILLVAAVDSRSIHYTPMSVAATYQSPTFSIRSEEEIPLTWEEKDRPFLQLDIWDAQAGAFVRRPVFTVAVPNGDGTLEARYRLRFYSEYALEANSLALRNAIPAELFSAFSDIAVSGYQGPLPAGGGDAAPAPMELGSLPVIARGDSGTLYVHNPRPTGSGQYYDVCYTVSYRGIRYGQLLENAVGAAGTQAVTPLQLLASARDGRTKAPLQACSFALYYTADSGRADTARPVRSITGLPIQFTDSTGEALFLPEGYAPGRPQAWRLTLVQQSAPGGYEAHIGREFPLQVHSDDDGNLQLTAAQHSALTAQAGDWGELRLTIDNTVPSPVTIYAADRTNIAKALSGAVFQLTRPDGATQLLPATARNGRVSFALSAPVSGSYAGEYRLLAVTPPQAYTGEAMGTIHIRLDESGAIASVQAGGTDPAAAYLNNDYTSISTLFSPIAQPTLLYTGDGAPLAEARFALTQPEGSFYRLLETDSAGQVSLAAGAPLFPGEYRLEQLTAPAGYAPLRTQVSFTLLENGTLRLHGAPGAAAVTGGGYCLRVVSDPLPSSRALPLGGLPSPTPGPRELRASIAETQAAGPVLAGSTAFARLPDGAPQPGISHVLLLVMTCMALVADVLLLAGMLRRRHLEKETPHE